MVFPGSPVVKNLRAKARDKGDAGLIPGAWVEEGRWGGVWLQSMGMQKAGHN